MEFMDRTVSLSEITDDLRPTGSVNLDFSTMMII